ncbi:hypothetical protein P3T18_001190 [Paraburkholderia sp. GAS199]
MLKHPTINKPHELRVNGTVDALTKQQRLADVEAFSFEEKLGLLVEREVSVRESRQTAARLRRAQLKFSDAGPEDIDYRSARGLDRGLVS